MKFKIVGTFVAEYEPQPEDYPNPGDVEDMLKIDVQGYKEDPTMMFVEAEGVEFTVEGTATL